jgi:pimeloyl-ACP methyl ester carboxylesterase
MISAFGVLLTVAATLVAGNRDGPLIERGGDLSRGILVNRTPGTRPFDPPDRSRPSLVFVHGLNPMPRVVHFTMTERLAESLERRGGLACNILDWDWNAATFESLKTSTNSEASIQQGKELACSLWRAGLDPARIHLIGHSAGGIVATSAAEFFARQIGRPAAQLTLLDPAAYYHSYIFDRMQEGLPCPIVENYWSPGPSAYGKEVAVPGVRNYRVDGPASFAGVICPLRSDHLFLVRWYFRTVEQPDLSYGFNTSRLLDEGKTH